MPLVPVTQRTRRRSASASHRPRPPTTGMPRRGQAGRLGPVAADARGLDDDLALLQGVQAAVAGGDTDAAARLGWSSTRTGSTPSARSLRTVRAGLRGRGPRRRPGRRAGRTRTSFGPLARSSVPGRDEVRADRVPHGRSVRLGRRVRPAGDLGREFCSSGVSARSGPAGGQQDRGPALVDLADALERLGARAEQRPGTSRPAPDRPAARPPSSREDRPQLLGRHERRQDQVDEAALVALPAPVVEPAGRVDVEGLITAAERRRGTGSRPANFSPDPELGPVSQRRRSSRAGPAAVGRPATSRKAASNAGALGVLVVHRRGPGTPGVGTDADHSLDITTASRSSSDGGEHRDRGEDAGHRHVPVAGSRARPNAAAADRSPARPARRAAR